jgi:hypothetical protein
LLLAAAKSHYNNTPRILAYPSSSQFCTCQPI